MQSEGQSRATLFQDLRGKKKIMPKKLIEFLLNTIEKRLLMSIS